MRSRHEQQRHRVCRCARLASLLLLFAIDDSPATVITGDEPIHRSD